MAETCKVLILVRDASACEDRRERFTMDCSTATLIPTLAAKPRGSRSRLPWAARARATRNGVPNGPGDLLCMGARRAALVGAPETPWQSGTLPDAHDANTLKIKYLWQATSLPPGGVSWQAGRHLPRLCPPGRGVEENPDATSYRCRTGVSSRAGTAGRPRLPARRRSLRPDRFSPVSRSPDPPSRR